MNRKDILDYARKTPTNTNVNVLGSMIDSVVRDSGESCGGVTYETIFEDDVEMRGVAPGIANYRFDLSEEQYDEIDNKLVPYEDIYVVTIGDFDYKGYCIIISSNGDKAVRSDTGVTRYIEAHMGIYTDNEMVTRYYLSFATNGNAGTYHVSLKRVIIPGE